MNLQLNVVSRKISPLLEKHLKKDDLEKILAMVGEHKTMSEIIESGLVDRPKLNLIIADFIKTGAIEILDPESEATFEAPLQSTRVVPTDKVETKSTGEIMLLTDSTADLPPNFIKERNIKVIPLSIRFEGKEYLDGIDIDAKKFYQLLRKSNDFPSTSPPSEKDFNELFLANIDKDILGMFISKKMSKTYDIAISSKIKNYNTLLKQRRQIQKDARGFTIEIIDTQLVSIGAGLLVVEASDRIQEGWPLEKVRDHILTLIPKVRVYFIADTLKYLMRGGRIGKARGFIGGIFHIRPILGITDGVVDSRATVRGGKKAQQRVIDLIKEDLGDPHVPIKAGICHADAQDWADQIKTLAENQLNCKSMLLSDFGPTVGSHTGPGTVGVAFFPLT